MDQPTGAEEGAPAAPLVVVEEEEAEVAEVREREGPEEEVEEILPVRRRGCEAETGVGIGGVASRASASSKPPRSVFQLSDRRGPNKGEEARARRTDLNLGQVFGLVVAASLFEELLVDAQAGLELLGRCGRDGRGRSGDDGRRRRSEVGGGGGSDGGRW